MVRSSDPGALLAAALEEPAGREITPGHRRSGREVGSHWPGRCRSRTHPGATAPGASLRRAAARLTDKSFVKPHAGVGEQRNF